MEATKARYIHAFLGRYLGKKEVEKRRVGGQERRGGTELE